jgi:hypothetical protein
MEFGWAPEQQAFREQVHGFIAREWTEGALQR